MTALESLTLGSVNFTGSLDDLILPSTLTYLWLEDKVQESLDLGFLAPSADTLSTMRLDMNGNLTQMTAPSSLSMPALRTVEVSMSK